MKIKNMSRSLCMLAVAGAFATTATANEKSFEEMDTDGDGVVTAVEGGSAARDVHDKADADQDGRVTASELQAAYASHQGAGGASHGEHGAEHFAEMIRKMDNNNDGAVSADEMAAAAREKHEKSDLDNDGNLSRAEFEAAKERMKDKQHDRKDHRMPGQSGH